MQKSVIQAAVPMAVKMIATQVFGIEVRFSGNQPYFDHSKKVFNMSLLPFALPQAKTAAFGIMIHELGHVEFTEAIPYPSTQHKNIGNALEDIRIEAAMMRKFPGAKKMLSDLVGMMVEEGYFRSPSDKMSIYTLVGFYALFKLRSNALDQTQVASLIPIYAEALKKLVPAVFHEIDLLINKSLKCKSKAEVLEITDQILALLNKDLEKQEQQQDSQSEQDKSGEDSSSDDENQESENDDSQNQSSDGSDVEEAEDGESTDLGDILMPLFSKWSAEAREERAPQMPMAEEMPKSGDVQEMSSRVTRATSGMTAKFEDLLEAQIRRPYRNSYSGPVLDKRNLWRLKIADSKIFCKKVQSEGVNTAVSMLVDRSGSMGSNIDLVMDVSYAVVRCFSAFEMVDVSTAVFPAQVKDCGVEEGQSQKGIGILKHFGEDFRRAAPRFAKVGVFGETPLADAAMWSICELLEHPADRKILLVATDGAPDNVEAAKQVIREAESMGIDVVMIGIRHDTKRFCKRSIRVDEIPQLSAALYNSFSELLESKAA